MLPQRARARARALQVEVLWLFKPSLPSEQTGTQDSTSAERRRLDTSLGTANGKSAAVKIRPKSQVRAWEASSLTRIYAGLSGGFCKGYKVWKKSPMSGPILGAGPMQLARGSLVGSVWFLFNCMLFHFYIYFYLYLLISVSMSIYSST